MGNNDRFDLSPYLIHFFRKIEVAGYSAPPLPEHWGFGNIGPEGDIPPLFLLRCALRRTRLWATWSVRKGARTIYGNSPAVCFTEMPISAFLEAGSARWARGENMSPYGIVFPKDGLFLRGSNPVIYGLDARGASLPQGRNGQARIINSEVLPLQEQYRYVTYRPARSRRIDWTHEREWRWPYRESTNEFEQDLKEFGWPSDPEGIPGFNFAGDDLNGMGVIVGSAKEAHLVSYDILTLVDRQIIGADQFSFILKTEELPSPSELREPASIRRAIAAARIDLRPYFRTDLVKAANFGRRFSEIVASIENSVPEPEHGEIGGCWLWLSDNTHDLTRSLLHQERIIVNKEGRYLVDLEGFSDSRSLRQREDMTKELATQIKKEFGLDCAYFSILGKDDPDQVPFYTEPDFDWPFFNLGDSE